MTDITPQLTVIFGGRLKQNEIMANHTNFKIGGPARWLVEVKTIEELSRTIETAENNGVSYYVMGGGSNLLVSDSGFDGVVIKLANRKYSIEGTEVNAGAGVITALLARETAEAGLQGLEWAITLPGTIGGAVRGNAGCFGGEMKDNVKSVKVFKEGQIHDLTNGEMQFGYRDSLLKHEPGIIWEAVFELKRGDAEQLKKVLTETLAKRKETQPLGAPSAGCTFKNFEFDDESALEILKRQVSVPQSMIDKGQLSAGWVIDQCDLKGKRIGNARVSMDHANFIENVDGKATASDVIQLISVIKMEARDNYGIQLMEEIEYLGF